MTYLSITFILFLITTMLLYYIFPKRIRWIILLAASMVFYLYAGYDKFLIVKATSLIIWSASWAINKQYCRAERKAVELGISGKEKAALFAKYKRKCRNPILIPTFFLVYVICMAFMNF